MDRSEDKSPAAAGRRRVLSEAEGKRPNVLTASQRDKEKRERRLACRMDRNGEKGRGPDGGGGHYSGVDRKSVV